MPKEKAKQKQGGRSSDPRDEIFRNLTESAFEFLERAIREFRDSPKFSTIHFATAVELFLKARLMREHWSLTVEKIDDVALTQFRQGKFKSVSPSAAIARLRSIVDVVIPSWNEPACGSARCAGAVPRGEAAASSNRDRRINPGIAA